jgi:hypothetical protein
MGMCTSKARRPRRGPAGPDGYCAEQAAIFGETTTAQTSCKQCKQNLNVIKVATPHSVISVAATTHDCGNKTANLPSAPILCESVDPFDPSVPPPSYEDLFGPEVGIHKVMQ